MTDPGAGPDIEPAPDGSAEPAPDPYDDGPEEDAVSAAPDGEGVAAPSAHGPGAALGAASLLAARVADGWAAVAAGVREGGAQSVGFAARVLAGVAGPASGEQLPARFDDLAACAEACRYGGAPDVAHFGFALAARTTADVAGRTGVAAPAVFPGPGDSRGDATAAFLGTVERLHGRSPHAQDALAADDVALLGLADGLAACRASHAETGGALDRGTTAGSATATSIYAAVSWLVGLVDGRAPQGWTGRLRALAGDLLDGRGRLKARIEEADPAAVALDLVLRRRWPAAMRDTPHLGQPVQQGLMATLLREPAPPAGALEQAAVRLAALDALLMQTAAALVPTVGEVARILTATQGAMKRWVWEEKPGRKGVGAARWLIDDEAHVQAFLWTVLSPHFGPHLRDEQYLPGYGLKQPRADFGITTVKLIVEVKIARTPADFRKIEEEVAGDLGLYFSDPARWDRMLVYVYDDCDTAHPELYDSLRVALTQRDARVEDVIMVRRPSMIPDRGARG